MSKNQASLKLICMLSVLVICMFAVNAPAAIIGMSEFTDCLQTDADLTCQEKMLFTIPVSFGLSNYLEVVTIASGSGIVAEEQVVLEITKSKPKLIYPLRYFHTVAYYPHEKVTQLRHPISPCGNIDCNNSNGFNIVRSLLDLEEGWGSCLFRGEELFGGPATLEEPYCTKHSLEMGAVYFHGYEIGKYTKDYEIEIKMIQGSEEHTVKLSPMVRRYAAKHDETYSGTFNLKAELIGDTEPYSGELELDNYILYIPSTPDGHEMVIDYQNNMLLVPREEVSKDGSEIDKITISKYAFKKLKGDYDISKAGDGLGNQLFHKHNSDLQKLTINPAAETTYLVHGKKVFKDSMEFKSGMEKCLVQSIPEIDNSLLTLTTDKGMIKEITTQSKGIILYAKVENFGSMSDEGILSVLVKNVGDWKTDYIVMVTMATMNILKAIPAQARTLQPLDEVEFEFDISTLYNIDTTNEVLVSLLSPTGKVFDKVWAKFDTFKHDVKSPGDFYEKNTASVGVEMQLSDSPVITINGDNPMLVECGGIYEEYGATATDDNDGAVDVEIGGTVNASKCATYTIIYTATDSECNTAIAVRTVEVLDTTKPIILLNGPNPVVLAAGADYVELATAEDNCNDDVPLIITGSVDTSLPAEYILTYDAVDDCGNQADQVTRTVIVEACDTTPPALTVTVEPSQLWPPNHKMVKISVTATAIDNVDPNPVVSLVDVTLSEGNKAKDVKILADGSIYLRAETGASETGRVYTITYRAVDASGNSTDEIITITVPHDQSRL